MQKRWLPEWLSVCATWNRKGNHFLLRAWSELFPNQHFHHNWKWRVNKRRRFAPSKDLSKRFIDLLWLVVLDALLFPLTGYWKLTTFHDCQIITTHSVIFQAGGWGVFTTFWAAAPKGPMTYAFTQEKFLLLLLLLLLLHPSTPFEAHIPALRQKSQPWGPNSNLEGQILASRPKS